MYECPAQKQDEAEMSATSEKETPAMSFGPMELMLILAIVLIIFGAGKLPHVLGSLGKGVKEFREASEGSETSSASATTSPTPTAPTTPGAPATTAAQSTTTVNSHSGAPATPAASTDQQNNPR